VNRKPDGAGTPLQAAVQRLDEELARFDQLAQSARKIQLTSERNLEKAARAINDAAESQRRVTEHIQLLIEAISTARTRHDEVAAALLTTRDDVQARAERFQAQLARFAALGKEAADISGQVRELGAVKDQPNAAIVALLTSVKERMGGVVSGAAALAVEADAEAMEDLARQCDSLKQQVQSALNKVTLLRDKLSATLA
jgi:chromosome segregation ATPase